MDLPKIISVDDQVAEPSHVWQTWLPESTRKKQKGSPSARRAQRWGQFSCTMPGAKYVNPEDPRRWWGAPGTTSVPPDYVIKRFRRDPAEPRRTAAVSRFDRPSLNGD